MENLVDMPSQLLLKMLSSRRRVEKVSYSQPGSSSEVVEI
jgi:hypothetical protein